MTDSRRMIGWTTLAAVGLMIVLALIGAVALPMMAPKDADGRLLQPPAELAAGMFNSAPMVFHWFALATLLIVSVLGVRRLSNSWTGAAMHIGLLLVLLGGMWGSQRAHALRQRVTGDTKVAKAVMFVGYGQPTNELLDRRTGVRIGSLPCTLRLESFRIDYYDDSPRDWALTYRPADDAGAMRLDWTTKREFELPDGLRLRVLEYLPHAGVRWLSDRGEVGVLVPGGQPVALPAAPGQSLTIQDPPAQVRVVAVRAARQSGGAGPDTSPDSAPDGPDGRPVASVEITHGGASETVDIAAGTHGRGGGAGLFLWYDMPREGYEDPQSPLPGMKVRIASTDGQSADVWLLPKSADGSAVAALVSDREGDSRRPAEVCLAAPPRMPSQYHSYISVHQPGQAAERMHVFVNGPAHYAGYHFYQTDWDKQAERFTVLTVTSDSGLATVAAGGALLTLGVFGGCWGVPAYRFLRGRASPRAA